MKILELLKEQRKYFIRLADGTKHIINPLLYYSFEDELTMEYEKIGRENKKKIIDECNRKGINIPNFKTEGL